METFLCPVCDAGYTLRKPVRRVPIEMLRALSADALGLAMPPAEAARLERLIELYEQWHARTEQDIQARDAGRAASAILSVSDLVGGPAAVAAAAAAAAAAGEDGDEPMPPAADDEAAAAAAPAAAAVPVLSLKRLADKEAGGPAHQRPRTGSDAAARGPAA
nr:hypothetical protein HK105_001344 [Polyrhizophydium stewartii]